MTTDTRSIRLCLPAFAKINLSLEVRGVRADGYHDLSTVFQSIELHDVLSFSEKAGPFDIRCDDPACPTDRTNLIWRAAQLAWRAGGGAGSPRGVRVRLQKRIPMQSGLGGGSSDAATTLLALSKIWRLVLTSKQLARLARKLGADVGFFLEGGTALGEGAGDRLEHLADSPRSWVVLIVPGFGVSTKDAYGWFDHDRRAGVSESTRRGPVPANDLQPPVAARHPEISEIVEALKTAGASQAAMSGSGSAVFGLFRARSDAVTAARRLENMSRRAIVTRTVARREFGNRGRFRHL
jgi:4-diphosphocytidyl-2-C-methyl-D-erythritol kinase